MKRGLRKKILRLLICLCGVLFVTAVVSHARAADLPIGWTNVRALGMGNAYTAVVKDADALFYNPAGLARIEGFHWTVFDIHAGVNGVDNIQAVTGLANSSSDLTSIVNSLYGKRVWAGGGGKTAITTPIFSAAGYANAEAGVFVTNPANTTMNLNYYLDYGITVGTGIDLIPGIFKLGLVGRRVNRTGTTLPLGPSVLATLDTSALADQLKSRGTGYGLDLGSVLTFPGPISPTLSFVYRDVGTTTFSHDEGAAAPPGVASEMIIGAAFEINAPLITITPAVDYRYANRPDVQLGKKLNLGLEVSLPLIALRGGFQQGYYTAGVGLDLALLRIDVATYGVELGEYPGQLEDRRYMAQVTFELGFDPGKFGFGSSSSGSGSSEHRRLKQRR